MTFRDYLPGRKTLSALALAALPIISTGCMGGLGKTSWAPQTSNRYVKKTTYYPDGRIKSTSSKLEEPTEEEKQKARYISILRLGLEAAR